MKKAWQKPRLIILARSRPQEAILQICKGYQVGTIPMSGYNGCGAGVEPVCVTCEVFSTS